MNELIECLCCRGPLVPLIDFGPMPLVNTYEVKEAFPLAVNRCVSCCHLQLSQFVDPELLYRNYTYQSGTGQTALDFFTEFARIALSYFPTARNVLDIACNDGTQLDAFKTHGLETFGIDPAENLSAISTKKGHKVCSLFFEETRSESLEKPYDIITAQNVLAHTPDPLRFLRKCARLMSDHSRLFVVTSQANMIVNGECDTIYHEHISYFNAHSMIALAKRAGLQILDVLMPDIHGTSFVFVLVKGENEPKSESVIDRLGWEFSTGMMAAPIYTWWKKHALWRVERLRRTVSAYKEQGFYSVGAGAAAKGISMLNMADMKLDVIVDSTPTKWNKASNGMPILPFDRIEFITHEKALFVILPWNLREEIRRNVLRLRNNKKDVFIDTK